MENIITYSVGALIALALMIAFVQIIVQIMKQFTWSKIDTKLLAVIVSIVTAVVVFLAFAKITGLTIVWYMVAAAVVLGVLIAYGAIFGYDNLIAIIITAVKSGKSAAGQVGALIGDSVSKLDTSGSDSNA